MNISNFYFGAPMDRPEYMCLPYKLMPQEIIDKYNLSKLEDEGWVYVKIVKGMYGLPQAGILTNKLLQKRLKKWGYFPVQFTPGLWRHAWQPVPLTLVVDDFGVKFVGPEHAHHLKKCTKRTLWHHNRLERFQICRYRSKVGLSQKNAGHKCERICREELAQASAQTTIKTTTCTS